MLQDSGSRREFETGAVRDMGEGKGRCDLLPACALLRLAKHYEAGALKYSARNWEKGLPISCLLDSGIRHLLKYLDGQTDEDHLAAAAWNILGAMWMEQKRPDLQDVPSRLGEQETV
ncbi:MAG: dATP/dGTP diphosphohydrolase domain-containing protein [Bacillota bacterium]